MLKGCPESRGGWKNAREEAGLKGCPRGWLKGAGRCPCVLLGDMCMLGRGCCLLPVVWAAPSCSLQDAPLGPWQSSSSSRRGGLLL